MARKQGVATVPAAGAAPAGAASGSDSGFHSGPGASVRTPATTPATGAGDVAGELHNVRFSLRSEIAYHGARELFLARLGRFLTGLQVLLGTAAVAMIADAIPGSAPAFVSVAALCGVGLLVLDPFAGAREHRVLRGRFHELMAECEGRDCSAADLRDIKARMQRVMASAPPAYRALRAVAHNLAINATYPETTAATYRYHVGPVAGLFSNWFAMRGMRFGLETEARTNRRRRMRRCLRRWRSLTSGFRRPAP